MYLQKRLSWVARITLPAATLLAPTIGMAGPLGKAAQQPNTEVEAHAILEASGSGFDVSDLPVVGGGDVEVRTRTKDHRLELEGSVGAMGTGRLIGDAGFKVVANPEAPVSLIIQERPISATNETLTINPIPALGVRIQDAGKSGDKSPSRNHLDLLYQPPLGETLDRTNGVLQTDHGGLRMEALMAGDSAVSLLAAGDLTFNLNDITRRGSADELGEFGIDALDEGADVRASGSVDVRVRLTDTKMKPALYLTGGALGSIGTTTFVDDDGSTVTATHTGVGGRIGVGGAF